MNGSRLYISFLLTVALGCVLGIAAVSVTAALNGQWYVAAGVVVFGLVWAVTYRHTEVEE